MITAENLNVPYRLLPYGSRNQSVPAAPTATVPPPVKAWASMWGNTPVTAEGYRAGLGRLFPTGPIGPHYLREYTYVGG